MSAPEHKQPARIISRPPALTNDYDTEQRRIDVLLQEQAIYEDILHAPDEGFTDRLFETSLPMLSAGAEGRKAAPLPHRYQFSILVKVIGIAAVITLMFALVAVLSVITGSQKTKQGTFARGNQNSGDLLPDISQVIIPVPEENSRIDQQIEETSKALGKLASADPWETGTIWGQLHSDAILDISGW